jgi:hypothetical protein
MANWEGGESEEENVLSDAEMQFSGTCALLNFVFFYLFVFQNCRGAWRRGFSGAYTRTFVCVCVCVCVCGVCVVCVWCVCNSWPSRVTIFVFLTLFSNFMLRCARNLCMCIRQHGAFKMALARARAHTHTHTAAYAQ